jgi:hypothetical protein
VRDEDIDELFTALDQAFGALGAVRFDEAIKEALARFAELETLIKPLADRSAFRKRLRRAEKPESDQWQELLRKIKTILNDFRPVILATGKKLPHPLGGRPTAKSVEGNEEKICVDISDLHRKRVPLKVAYSRVAKKYKVSARTIERIWSKRKGE